MKYKFLKFFALAILVISPFLVNKFVANADPVPTLSVPPNSTVQAGQRIDVTWGNIPNVTTTDWIGLFIPSTSNNQSILWTLPERLENGKCNVATSIANPLSSGSCSFPVFASGVTVFPGTYQLRYFHYVNNTSTLVATSNNFTIIPSAPYNIALKLATHGATMGSGSATYTYTKGTTGGIDVQWWAENVDQKVIGQYGTPLINRISCYSDSSGPGTPGHIPDWWAQNPNTEPAGHFPSASTSYGSSNIKNITSSALDLLPNGTYTLTAKGCKGWDTQGNYIDIPSVSTTLEIKSSGGGSGLGTWTVSCDSAFPTFFCEGTYIKIQAGENTRTGVIAKNSRGYSWYDLPVGAWRIDEVYRPGSTGTVIPNPRDVTIVENQTKTTVLSFDDSAYNEPPPEFTFKASPETIKSGEASLLTWLTEGRADSCDIDKIGNVNKSNGSLSVKPTTTTTYKMTCTSKFGSRDITATVTVNGSSGGGTGGGTDMCLQVNAKANPTSGSAPLSVAFNTTVNDSCTKGSSGTWSVANSAPFQVTYAGASCFAEGYLNTIKLYEINGQKRLISDQNWGYSTYSLGNLDAPMAIGHHPMFTGQGCGMFSGEEQFSKGNPFIKGGDGQTSIEGIGVSTDGKRMIISGRDSTYGATYNDKTTGTSPGWIFEPSSNIFAPIGSFGGYRSHVAILKNNGRYYAFTVTAGDGYNLRYKDVTEVAPIYKERPSWTTTEVNSYGYGTWLSGIPSSGGDIFHSYGSYLVYRKGREGMIPKGLKTVVLDISQGSIGDTFYTLEGRPMAITGDPANAQNAYVFTVTLTDINVYKITSSTSKLVRAIALPTATLPGGYNSSGSVQGVAVQDAMKVQLFFFANFPNTVSSLQTRFFHLQVTGNTVSDIDSITTDVSFLGRATPAPYNDMIGVSDGNNIYIYIAGSTSLQKVKLSRASSGTSASAYTYNWDFGDNTTSSAKNPSHKYSSVGAHTARVTVTASTGKTNYKDVTTTATTGSGGGGDDGTGNDGTSSQSFIWWIDYVFINFLNL